MIKIPKDSLFIVLVLNAVLINVYHVKAVQDDISAKTVPIGFHHTVAPKQRVGGEHRLVGNIGDCEEHDFSII